MYIFKIWHVTIVKKNITLMVVTSLMNLKKIESPSDPVSCGL